MINKKTILSIALASIGLLATSGAAHAASVSGQGTWETTLQGRDLDGNLSTFEAYYDTVLNITWLANATYFGNVMTWANANTWASGLNINGYTGWRLPTVSPVDGTTADDANVSNIGTEDRGFNISAPGTLYAGSTASEMAHLFYNTLGDKAYCNPTTSTVSNCVLQAGYGISVNAGPFSNVELGYYWSATVYAPDTSNAWLFDVALGRQYNGNKTTYRFAWAVHSGDVGVSVVPVPAAVWLFGSGLLGLIGVARKK